MIARTNHNTVNMKPTKEISVTEAIPAPESASVAQSTRHPLLELLAIPSFRSVWIGSTLSLIGDVCFAVSLPWLVLQMTGSSIALGGVMVALVTPRVLLLLVGGALSDKLPPRNILMIAYSSQMICVAIVAAMLTYDALRLPQLYVLVFIFGISDAFISPALHVLLPQLVSQAQLPRANSMLQSTSQLCMLAGATIVGIAIAKWGVTFAFVIDALSFVFIIGVLLAMRPAAHVGHSSQSMLQSVGAGLRYVWADAGLRALLVTSACVNFCVTGVNEVGFAALANTRFGSSSSFGFLMTSVGVGALTGLLLAGAYPRKGTIQATVVKACVVLSLLLGALSVELPLWEVCLLTFGQGVVAGYINIQVLSWLQTTVKREMLGRVMSVLGFATLGVTPVSLAISGVLARSHVGVLFLSAAALLLLTMLLFLDRRGNN